MSDQEKIQITRDDLQKTLQVLMLAYRYVHLQDHNIGTEECADAIHVALTRLMGDEAFERWLVDARS